MKLAYTKSLGQVLTTYEIEGDYDECLRMAKALDITPVVNFKLDPIVKQTPATGGIMPCLSDAYCGDSSLKEVIPFTRGEDGSIKIEVPATSVSGGS